MVKKEELMIGDYVSVSGTPLKIAALGTVKAGFLDGKGEMFYHSYDSIAPIQLTDEILEKNGFRILGGVFKLLYETCNGWYHARLGEVKRGLYLADLQHYKTELYCRKSYYGAINYFHELQHALRLCGINKEIEP